MRTRRLPTVLVVTAALATGVVGVTGCSKTNRPAATVTTTSTKPSPALSFFANPPTTAPPAPHAGP
jgi:hypothetical protein